MIVIKLQGGMGNQMFQYALGRKLEKKYNMPMCLDLSFLKRRDFGPNFMYRDYDLDIFNVNPTLVDTPPQIDMVVNEPSLVYYEQISNIYNYIPTDKNIYVDGYFQCDKYFKEIENEIKKEFTFVDSITEGKEKDMLDDIQNSNSILINIRRTDYLNTSFHGVFGSDFVNDAVAMIREKVENPKFFIFSDDVDWCRDNLHVENSVLVDHTYAGKKFETYLQLMVNCKHFIIPNSTFAWWAAWLCDNPNKIVIAPQKWFAQNTPTDIIYDEMGWIRI